MKKIIILIFCLSLIASCSLFKKDTSNYEKSFIRIYFEKNGLITENLALGIFDDLKCPIKYRRDSIIYFKFFIEINSDSYSNFLEELKLIDSIKDSYIYEKSSIMIDIIKKDTLVDIYRFKNKAQFKKYIEVSDEIFEEDNYVPIRDCLEELK